MILKEKQFTNSDNPKVRAGEEAEKQMAFYLQREFGKEKNCFVLNDLRIINDGDSAQIDHLIVTEYGLFIIESKSVYGEITVNQNAEWSRSYNNSLSGMASPILQAEAQGKVLKALLAYNKEKLLSKMFGALQKGFGHCPVNVYVAISDKGIINRKKAIPELFKADQVCIAIKEKLSTSKKISSLLSLSMDIGWEMRADETIAVANFLLSQHKPLLKPDLKTLDLQLPANKPNHEHRQLQPTLINKSEKSFIPKAGALCPQCNQLKLIRKSVQRADGTETDFLACSGYPKDCKAIFALVAVAKPTEKPVDKIATLQELKEHDNCPRCKSGKLVIKLNKAKNTKFTGCSEFPKCRFTI